LFNAQLTKPDWAKAEEGAKFKQEMRQAGPYASFKGIHHNQ
jgi:hypothetical protein